MSMELSPENTLRNLERRWANTDRALLRRLFPLLARGHAWSTAELSAELGEEPDVLDAALEAGPVGVSDGRLVELFGFMLQPTLQRVVVDGRAMFTCCAVVAHALPPLVERPVRVESVDPVDRGIVTLKLLPDGSVESHPGAAATFVVSPRKWDDTSVRDAFCSHVRHFSGVASAEEFAARDPRRTVVSLRRLHRYATTLVHRIWE